ncbi:MAG: hypothetical protein AVDCRST_MAG73-2527, partial [uncultured Thermomicrobiales bacterium]
AHPCDRFPLDLQGASGTRSSGAGDGSQAFGVGGRRVADRLSADSCIHGRRARRPAPRRRGGGVAEMDRAMPSLPL